MCWRARAHGSYSFAAILIRLILLYNRKISEAASTSDVSRNLFLISRYYFPTLIPLRRSAGIILQADAPYHAGNGEEKNGQGEGTQPGLQGQASG